MAQYDLFLPPKRPWNTARIIGPKPPFKPKHIWGIRQQLKANGRMRDLAMFNCAIDSKLRGCDLVRLRISDVAPGARSEPVLSSSNRRQASLFLLRSLNQREMRCLPGSRSAAVGRTTGFSRAVADRATM